ncbi:MAG: glycosyltransferase family 9 protein [Planctomycetota bacterium]
MLSALTDRAGTRVCCFLVTFVADISGDTPKRILIVRPSALGDVCRTVPVLRRLRIAYPAARIDWLVQDSFSDAVSAHPDLSNVVPFERSRMAVKKVLRKDARSALRALVEQLVANVYDLAIDCQGLSRSGFFTWSTRARRRIGYADAREFGTIWLTDRVTVPREGHTVDRMLALLPGIDTTFPEAPATPEELRLHTPPFAQAQAMELVGDPPPLVVAPTSRWPGKRWPDERFAKLIGRMLDDRVVERVALVGGPDELEQVPVCATLAETRDPVINLIGKTGVGELMGVIEASRMVLANDSAALHMAVGFDKPLVALFGPTRSDLVGPYGRDHDVLQGAPPNENRHKEEAYGKSMMEKLTIDDVYTATCERLERTREGASA